MRWILGDHLGKVTSLIYMRRVRPIVPGGNWKGKRGFLGNEGKRFQFHLSTEINSR